MIQLRKSFRASQVSAGEPQADMLKRTRRETRWTNVADTEILGGPTAIAGESWPSVGGA